MAKKIFKILIAVPLIIVSVLLMIELLYSSITSQQLKNNIRKSLSNACESFNQESFYGNSLSDLVNSKGGLYISGNVYGTNSLTSDESKYSYLFGYDGYEEYYKWLTSNTTYSNNGSSAAELYKDLGYLKLGLEWRKSNSGSVDVEVSNYSDVLIGTNQVDSLYTPMNLGVPYVGTMEYGDRAKQAVENMFKWNLTQMVSECGSDTIEVDGSDVLDAQHVVRDGWVVYTREAEIESIEYLVFDTNSSKDREELYKLVSVGEGMYSGTDESNRYITVVKVGYKVPVGYRGVTSVANWVAYAMSKGSSNVDSSKYNYYTTYISSSETGSYVYYYNID